MKVATEAVEFKQMVITVDPSYFGWNVYRKFLNHDNRWDSDVVATFWHKESAEELADERNKMVLRQCFEEAQNEHARKVANVREHNVLVAAGLRSGSGCIAESTFDPSKINISKQEGYCTMDRIDWEDVQ